MTALSINLLKTLALCAGSERPSTTSSQRAERLALANLQNATRTGGAGVRGFSSEKTRAKTSSGVSKKIAPCNDTLFPVAGLAGKHDLQQLARESGCVQVVHVDEHDNAAALHRGGQDKGPGSFLPSAVPQIPDVRVRDQTPGERLAARR